MVKFSGLGDLLNGSRNLDKLVGGLEGVLDAGKLAAKRLEIDEATTLFRKNAGELFTDLSSNPGFKDVLTKRMMKLDDLQFDKLFKNIPEDVLYKTFDSTTDIGRRAAGMGKLKRVAGDAGDLAKRAGRGAADAAGKGAEFCGKHPIACAAVPAVIAGKMILDEFKDKTADIKNCTYACLPDNYDDVKYGDLEVDDYIYQTMEKLNALYGRDDITELNQPVCKVAMKDNCGSYCSTSCESMFSTTTDDLLNLGGDAAAAAAAAAAEAAAAAAAAAGEAAGAGISGVLDGIFGDGMGIMSMVGIAVVIVIIMVVVSTM